jgi:hypothetical protein
MIEKFRQYEAIHRAKPDLVKAEANAAVAERIEATLAKLEEN